MDVGFRRLVDEDLPLLHGWLNEPGVVRWWEGDDVSWDGVVRDYGSANTEPVEHWLALVDDAPVGWIQCYASSAFEHEDETRAWRALGVEPTAAGIDYLVGAPQHRGHGLGTAMIRAFVDEVVFERHPDWTSVCASPMTANAASVGALARAGFSRVGTFAGEHGEATLMQRRRLAEPRDL